jgi:hypothetical protein
VDQSFLSSYGDDALLHLGDAAFERGDYNSARRYWERIAPGLRFVPNNHEHLYRASNRSLWLPFVGVKVADVWPIVAPLFANPSPPTELVYPDTDLSVPEVRARLVMASLMEGNWERARIEIELLRQEAPAATGTIAGRSGRLVELLSELAVQARSWPSIPSSGDWPTFAGSADRQHPVPELAQLSNEPLWSVPLPRWASEREALSLKRVRVAENSFRLLPHHPLIVNDLAVVQTGPSREEVQAYHLRTGEPVLPAIERSRAPIEILNRTSVFGVPRFAPTAAGTNLCLLDGFTLVSAADDRQRLPAKLETIDLAADRKLLWDYSPKAPAWPDSFTLAGPPAVAGPRVFVTLRSREAGREQTHVAALDLRDGRLLWRQMVGTAEPFVEPTITVFTHLMLTVRHETVYCNTNNGLVAALEASTGHVRWQTSYPRSGSEDPAADRNKLHLYRDLNPCLLYRDILVVAPTDCNRLFALDATTGIPVWVTPAELAADAVHLLGVSQDRLVVSGECVYWFEIHSGRLVGLFPESFKAAAGFARPEPRGYGRGVLAGQHLYWPTRDAIVVIGAGTNQLANDWRPVVVREIDLSEFGATGGNLSWGNRTLLIAGADRLLAFDAPIASK